MMTSNNFYDRRNKLYFDEDDFQTRLKDLNDELENLRKHDSENKAEENDLVIEISKLERDYEIHTQLVEDIESFIEDLNQNSVYATEDELPEISKTIAVDNGDITSDLAEYVDWEDVCFRLYFDRIGYAFEFEGEKYWEI